MNLSEACERNKGPILEILLSAFANSQRILEIGSGTGQHAVYFARHLPRLLWQPSDTAEYLAPLRARLAQETCVNLCPPVELDVRRQPWPFTAADGVFSANTLHIMAWQAVRDFFSGVGAVLSVGGMLCVYGPFRYAKRYTSGSNEGFDRYLRERDAASGIRDFEAVDALATRAGLALQADHAMPANNRLLVWRRACDITSTGST
jgi:cyclopropane fatty-acyl-phospholipid synthase-like methyltransferase